MLIFFRAPIPWQQSEKQHDRSSFLDLPRELRDIIYHYHFGENIEHSMYKEFWDENGPSLDLSIRLAPTTEESPWTKDVEYEDEDEAQEPLKRTELLLLSKQIHFEASEFLYTKTTFKLYIENRKNRLFFVQYSDTPREWGDRIDFADIYTDRPDFPIAYDSFIHRLSFVDIGESIAMKWFQPWLNTLSNSLVSTYSSLTHVNAKLSKRDFLDWDDID